MMPVMVLFFCLFVSPPVSVAANNHVVLSQELAPFAINFGFRYLLMAILLAVFLQSFQVFQIQMYSASPFDLLFLREQNKNKNL